MYPMKTVNEETVWIKPCIQSVIFFALQKGIIQEHFTLSEGSNLSNSKANTCISLQNLNRCQLGRIYLMLFAESVCKL